MQEINLFQLFTNPLNTMGIKYMVTGAVANIVYGEPRLTHDIDLVLEIEAEDAEKIAKNFPLDQFYCPPIEVIVIESKRRMRGHFNIIHHKTGFKADIYIAGDDPLHAWALQNRRRISLEGKNLWIAPVEYVVLRKLEYYREGGSEKHLQDIAGMIEASGDQIDWPFLTEKIKQYKLKEQAGRIKILHNASQRSKVKGKR